MEMITGSGNKTSDKQIIPISKWLYSWQMWFRMKTHNYTGTDATFQNGQMHAKLEVWWDNTNKYHFLSFWLFKSWVVHLSLRLVEHFLILGTILLCYRFWIQGGNFTSISSAVMKKFFYQYFMNRYIVTNNNAEDTDYSVLRILQQSWYGIETVSEIIVVLNNNRNKMR